MIVTQDPSLPTRFVVDFQYDQVLDAKRMRRAQRGKPADFWFNAYAAKEVRKVESFAPIRDWLKKAKAVVVFQPVLSASTFEADGLQISTWNETMIAMVFIDRAAASLFLLSMPNFQVDD